MCSVALRPSADKRIAAFQRGNDAALRVFRGYRHELARDPRKVGVGELESGERILAMGVETGRDEKDLRPVALERRQPAFAHRRAEFRRCRCLPASGMLTMFGAGSSTPEYG